MPRFGLRFWLFLPTPPPRLLLPPFSSLSAPSAPPPAERAWDFVSPESGKLKLYMSAWPRMDGRRNGKRREACCVAGLMKKLRGSRQPWAWLWMPLMMAGARRLYVQGLKERRVQRRAFRRAETGEKARGFSLRSYPSAHAVASRSCACGESETSDDSSLFFSLSFVSSLFDCSCISAVGENEQIVHANQGFSYSCKRKARMCSANSSIEMIIFAREWRGTCYSCHDVASECDRWCPAPTDSTSTSSNGSSSQLSLQYCTTRRHSTAPESNHARGPFAVVLYLQIPLGKS
jgi:hypothetical protein